MKHLWLKEETDNEDPALFIQHKANWRAKGLLISTNLINYFYLHVLHILGLNKLTMKFVVLKLVNNFSRVQNKNVHLG